MMWILFHVKRDLPPIKIQPYQCPCRCLLFEMRFDELSPRSQTSKEVRGIVNIVNSAL